MNRTVGLDEQTLVSRYLGEMGHVIGRKSMLDLNLLALLEDLYGEDSARRIEKRLAERR